LKLHAPAVVNYEDKILVMGGTTNGSNIDSAFMYDPATEKWTVLTMHLPEGRTYHRAAVLGSCVYVYGGQDAQLAGTLIKNCSPLASIQGKGNIGNANEMIIYPNPNEGIFSVQTEIFNNAQYKIFVSDALGKNIEFDYSRSGNTMSINLKNPLKGFYNVKIISDNEMENRTLIIN
jgi:hypothetical protein